MHKTLERVLGYACGARQRSRRGLKPPATRKTKSTKGTGRQLSLSVYSIFRQLRLPHSTDERKVRNSIATTLLLLTLFAYLVLGLYVALGQTESLHSWQVFLEVDIDESGLDRLTFVDALTGDTATVQVFGKHYTLLADAVLFLDEVSDRVMLATPNERVQGHPFMQPGSETRRIDWLVSPDKTLLAWTLTNGSSATNLSTLTTVANVDGTFPRQVLVDGPRDGIRALPVAFSADQSALYMDYQPDGIGDFTPFQQYAGLFQVGLESGEVANLPGEPGCFCGAGFGAGLFIRLSLTSDLSGFDVHVHNLAAEAEEMIPAVALRNYTQAGNVLVSPDGSQAVYALSQVLGFGTDTQSARTVLVLLDLVERTQTPLTEPITTFVQPLGWTEDNSAVLFAAPERNGTWKVTLADGALEKVAEATYLGMVQGVGRDSDEG